MQENYRKFQCQNCDFSLWVVLSGRDWQPEEVAELDHPALRRAADRISQPHGQAVLRRHPAQRDYKLEFDFGQARLDEEARNPPDFSSQESLGACPKCGARVFEYGAVYVCEKAVGPDAHLRFPLRQDDPAAAGRARADAEAAGDRPHRSPHAVHLQEGTAVQGLSGEDRRRQGRLRVRGSRAAQERAARAQPRQPNRRGGSVAPRFQLPPSSVPRRRPQPAGATKAKPKRKRRAA